MPYLQSDIDQAPSDLVQPFVPYYWNPNIGLTQRVSPNNPLPVTMGGALSGTLSASGGLSAGILNVFSNQLPQTAGQVRKDQSLSVVSPVDGEVSVGLEANPYGKGGRWTYSVTSAALAPVASPTDILLL